MRTLVLTPEEHAALVHLRDHADRAYLRERAAALLKVASGTAPAVVAREGLLRRRQAKTLYNWLNRYRDQGLAGLTLRPGRGRKPAFPPSGTHHYHG